MIALVYLHKAIELLVIGFVMCTGVFEQLIQAVLLGF